MFVPKRSTSYLYLIIVVGLYSLLELFNFLAGKAPGISIVLKEPRIEHYGYHQYQFIPTYLPTTNQQWKCYVLGTLSLVSSKNSSSTTEEEVEHEACCVLTYLTCYRDDHQLLSTWVCPSRGMVLWTVRQLIVSCHASCMLQVY